MKKRKLKTFVMPVIYGLMCATIFLTILVLQKTTDDEQDNNIYVNSSIVSKTIPTVSEVNNDSVIIKPFTSEKVQVYKKFYDKNLTSEELENAMLFYNNTYVQNTGTLFKSDEQFDVVSILDGEITDIKKDETLGNVIEIKYDSIITTYYGLNEIKVKKGNQIKQGDIIGTSGKINIDNLNNSLLLEITKDGKLVNPESYFNKKINEL